MRDTLTSPRVEDMKRRRRAYHIRLSILLSILSITIIGALAYFSAHPKVTINTIVVTGTRIINPTEVESRVRADISGRYLHLFARANSLLYPRKKIYSDLVTQFPRIESLSLYRDTFTTLHVAIEERSGSYLYCGATIPEVVTDIGENCYFINSDGYIFDTAPYFSGDVYFKYYKALPKESSTTPLGLKMLPSGEFHALAQFIDGITNLGFKPTAIVIDANDVANLYLAHTVGTTTPTIVFKRTDNLNTILNNLALSMAKKEFANDINTKYTTLLYIDMRFPNRVVYKFQE